jgi:hypothetical protein
MDLSQIKTTDRTIEALHPSTGEKVGIRITLISIDDERMRLEARGKHFKAEDLESNKVNILAAAMTGWNWYNPTGTEGDKDYDPDGQTTWNGEVPEFNRKNVVAILSDPKAVWLQDQINEAVGETKAFF